MTRKRRVPDLCAWDASPDGEEEQECVVDGVGHDQEHDDPVEQIVSDPEEDSLDQPQDRVLGKQHCYAVGGVTIVRPLGGLSIQSA